MIAGNPISAEDIAFRVELDDSDPIANDDVAATLLDTPVNIDVLGNDVTVDLQATDDIDGLIRQTTRTLLDGMRVRRRRGA